MWQVTALMAGDEKEWLYQEAQKYQTIVEIGCFRGGSTEALLKGCPGTVYAVDLWARGDGWGKGIYEADPEEVYRSFKNNVGNGQYPNLVELRMDSLVAAEQLTADMVFIDACHDYEAVKQDIWAWLPNTRKIICGHDYGEKDYPGVKQAVDEIFGKPHGLVNSIWYVRVDEF